MSNSKLQWLDTNKEKFVYLFAQGFGNCVAEAYRYKLQNGEFIDPVEFVTEQVQKAIEHLQQFGDQN